MLLQLYETETHFSIIFKIDNSASGIGNITIAPDFDDMLPNTKGKLLGRLFAGRFTIDKDFSPDGRRSNGHDKFFIKINGYIKPGFDSYRANFLKKVPF